MFQLRAFRLRMPKVSPEDGARGLQQRSSLAVNMMMLHCEISQDLSVARSVSIACPGVAVTCRRLAILVAVSSSLMTPSSAQTMYSGATNSVAIILIIWNPCPVGTAVRALFRDVCFHGTTKNLAMLPAVTMHGLSACRSPV